MDSGYLHCLAMPGRGQQRGGGFGEGGDGGTGLARQAQMVPACCAGFQGAAGQRRDREAG